MLLYIIPYVAVAVFLVAVVARIVKIVSLPLHLRWELYPVAHEKNSHGGSFFEHLDWWQKPRESSMAGELKVMIPEIVLLKGVHEGNRPLWWRSFPFHFGLYLCAALIALLVVGSVIKPEPGAGFGAFWYGLVNVVGFAGLGLMTLGSAALLQRRMSDPSLKNASSPADFFNLALFCFTGLVGLLAFITVEQCALQLQGLVWALVTFRTELIADASFPGLIFAMVVLASVVLAYIPLTHMSHFFTKYFMWHDVRWEDRVNERGSEMEKRIQQQLGYKVTWAAEHIQGGGTKTWGDVATEEVKK